MAAAIKRFSESPYISGVHVTPQLRPVAHCRTAGLRTVRHIKDLQAVNRRALIFTARTGYVCVWGTLP